MLKEKWHARDPERLYFIEIRYDDIFGTTEDVAILRAWFDSAGRGRWQMESALQYRRRSLSI